MGIRIVPLCDDYVMLAYDNNYWDHPETYYNTSSLEKAIEYFNLYIDDDNNLRRKDIKKIFLERYGIKENNADEFLSQLESIGNSLSTEMAIDNEFIFLDWMPNKYYEIGNRVYYSDGVYECICNHTAHSAGTPWDLPKFWKKLEHENKVEDWYPNSNYAEHDKVMYLGQVWFSKKDGNNDIPNESDSWITFGL